MMRFARQFAAAATLLAINAAALAHEGEGPGGIHWHYTDTSGFLLVVALATLAVWLSRGE